MIPLFPCNMKRVGPCFNIYLALTALCVLAFATTGCQTGKSKKPASLLRLHLETNPDGTGRNAPIYVGRDRNAFEINVDKTPFLDEGQVQHASIADDVGGFQIVVQYDRQGTLLLDQYTTA